MIVCHLHLDLGSWQLYERKPIDDHVSFDLFSFTAEEVYVKGHKHRQGHLFILVAKGQSN